MIEQNQANSLIALQAQKFDPQKQWDEFKAALAEPIEGITSETRYEELEGESWASVMQELGE